MDRMWDVRAGLRMPPRFLVCQAQHLPQQPLPASKLESSGRCYPLSSREHALCCVDFLKQPQHKAGFYG